MLALEKELVMEQLRNLHLHLLHTKSSTSLVQTVSQETRRAVLVASVLAASHLLEKVDR